MASGSRTSDMGEEKDAKNVDGGMSECPRCCVYTANGVVCSAAKPWNPKPSKGVPRMPAVRNMDQSHSPVRNSTNDDRSGQSDRHGRNDRPPEGNPNQYVVPSFRSGNPHTRPGARSGMPPLKRSDELARVKAGFERRANQWRSRGSDLWPDDN